MWSSWVKEKGITQVTYITKLKDGTKRVKEFFSMILERVFEMVWWGGLEEKMESHQKEILKLKCFLLSKYWLPLLFEETLGDIFPSLSFFDTPSLMTWGFCWYLRRNPLLQKLLFKWFNILEVDAYSRMELCMLTWLNYDYGDGGVVDILAVDTYSGVEVCMPIFLGEASN
jgi:hypothetical protein